jgi:hypothetical protein
MVVHTYNPRTRSLKQKILSPSPAWTTEQNLVSKNKTNLVCFGAMNLIKRQDFSFHTMGKVNCKIFFPIVILLIRIKAEFQIQDVF